MLVNNVIDKGTPEESRKKHDYLNISLGLFINLTCEKRVIHNVIDKGSPGVMRIRA